MNHIQTHKEIIKSSESSDEDKIRAKSAIEDLQLLVEKEIRSHQREVSFETKEYTVELTVSKYSDGLDEDENELFVPDYQRDFVWDDCKQSRLIESIMIGLPVPYIFIADVNDEEDPVLGGRTEIVDGSQRIRTLDAFVRGNLLLRDLKLLASLNGFTFEDLPKSRQRRFMRAPIRIIELGSCTESTRRDLFERINTGSDILKDMEVRKGSHLGDSKIYKDLIKPCSQNSLFIKNAPMTEAKERRGERLEFTLRFFAYLEEYKEFEHSVKNFLDQYLNKHKDISEERVSLLVEEFETTMAFTDEYFPHGFAKSEAARSTPRVRFEALAVGVALALREDPNLQPEHLSSWLYSDDFKKLTTSDAANSRPKVISRIEYVKDKLLNG